VFVAASTDCFPQLTLAEALDRLVDLEYTRVEIALREQGCQLKPSAVHANLEQAIRTCRDLQRLTPVAYFVEIDAPPPLYFEQFASCCKLAKATKVVVLVMRASELGTPFNQEIERLRELVRIATLESAVVALKTEVGRMTQDPSTAAVLCDTVKGLALTLDPSHFIYGPNKGVSYEPLLKHVCHVHLRDTRPDKLQVRVGQGDVEYGRLMNQLRRVRYNRALCVHIVDEQDPNVDHQGEMRKIRLLLESLL
jgi:sugar phosphate isomerase/epimerase